MGNLSSCSPLFPSFSRLSPPPSPLLAQVLLIDGSSLRFSHPIKVIRLLLDHPHHFVCPLDSLQPGHHSLSSLLPDEELQLGRLYLLLPFQTFQIHRTSGPFARLRKPPDSPALQEISGYFSTKEKPESGERARLLARNSSDACFSCPDFREDGASQLSDSESVKEKAPYKSIAGTGLCDTPELQRAYRPVMFRGCRTWTPRLQVIEEGRKTASKN